MARVGETLHSNVDPDASQNTRQEPISWLLSQLEIVVHSTKKKKLISFFVAAGNYWASNDCMHFLIMSTAEMAMEKNSCYVKQILTCFICSKCSVAGYETSKNFNHAKICYLRTRLTCKSWLKKTWNMRILLVRNV